MPELVYTIGLPASGKSTTARTWVAESPTTRARINRDDTRVMMHGARLGEAGERQITIVTHTAIAALLASDVDVICDDTNLEHSHRAALHAIAARADAEVRVIDLTSVPLAEVLRRNALRTGDDRVPEQWIVDMYALHVLDPTPECGCPQAYHCTSCGTCTRCASGQCCTASPED